MKVMFSAIYLDLFSQIVSSKTKGLLWQVSNVKTFYHLKDLKTLKIFWSFKSFIKYKTGTDVWVHFKQRVKTALFRGRSTIYEKSQISESACKFFFQAQRSHWTPIGDLVRGHQFNIYPHSCSPCSPKPCPKQDFGGGDPRGKQGRTYLPHEHPPPVVVARVIASR